MARLWVLVGVCVLAVGASAVAEDFYEGPDVSAAEILRARGFKAEELFLVTTSGYRLRMTRGRNPAIIGGHRRDRQPVLFVHGVLATANNFLVNSLDARPRDLTGISLTNTSEAELIELLADEPSARALPLLALNFGHEVWLVDRRGSTGSRERVGVGARAATSYELLEDYGQPPNLTSLDDLISSDHFEQALRAGGFGLSPQRPAATGRAAATTSTGWLDPITSFFKTITNFGALVQRVPQNLDTRFWNYSLDEQAHEDFVECIDFVLNQTGQARVSLVSHSSGGALALMSQSLYPERLASKLSSAIYWAPAYSVGYATPLASAVFGLLFPIGERIVGPLPPTFATPIVQASLSLLCANPLNRATICRALLTALYGDGGGREPAEPQLISSLIYSSSSHELAQLGQQLKFEPHSMHRFDLGPAGNRRAYGQPTAPAYDLQRVRARRESMSIYAGSTDMLVAPASVRMTLGQLGGNYKYKEIDEIPFSHVGYFFNEDAPRRAIIPSMRELETLAVR